MNLTTWPGHDAMNRTVRTVLFSMYFAALSMNVNGEALSVRAPELIGDGRAYVVQSGQAITGLVVSPAGVFTIAGSLGSRDMACSLTQISGEPIEGADHPVRCYLMRRGAKWVGWIDFRGSLRKFCAADQVEALPAACRLGR